MYYHSYELPLAVTEERLASIVCASVKDYLGEVTDYVARCQKTIDEQQETIDMLTSDKEALLRQVTELKECLAACHAMSTRAMIFNHKVGTVVAHADHVTLQYRAS